MSTKTICLITGANRGIGNGLVKAYASRPSTVVIAAVRDPSSSSSKALHSVPRAAGSDVILVKIDSHSETDAEVAVKQLKQEHGIDHLDIVIANAGIANNADATLKVPIHVVRNHLDVNLIGALVLFQATWPLLQQSSDPKFVHVSTTLSSMGDMENWPIPAAAYGASKAAMNYFSRKIHFEIEGLTSFAIHPGWVQTDMGNAAAQGNGMAEAPTTLEACIKGMMSKIDRANRKETSGRFLSAEGSDVDW